MREDETSGRAVICYSREFWMRHKGVEVRYVPSQRYTPSSNLGHRPEVAHILRRRCQKGANT